MSQLKAEWAKRGVVVAGLSVDEIKDHHGWVQDINELADTKMDYPLIADPKKEVSVLYGMLDPTHLDKAGLPLTIRSVFVIGPDKLIKLIMYVYVWHPPAPLRHPVRCVSVSPPANVM